ncbi:MAG: hypothetical protein ACOX81_02340 [Candidatus Heteroscillospira sp.]
MELLACEYRESGELCRSRAAELERGLRHRLKEHRISALDTMRLRRRIGALRSMARDCAATAAYLEHYYDRGLSYERYI